MSQLLLSAAFSNTPAHLPTHFHDCHQILYVLSGSCTFSVGGKTYSLTPGSLLLISRFEQHALLSQSEDYARFNLRLSPDVSALTPPSLRPLLSVLVNRPQHFSHAVDMSGCKETPRLLRLITEEMEAGGEFSDDMLALLFHQLLILLCRRHPSLLAGGGRQLEQAEEVRRYLEENYCEHITLHTLSQSFHVSASHLSHLFKSVTGQSIMEYLSACRVAAAKRMLLETDEAISRIVEKCGFTDASNFSRSFRAAEGVTPSEFRRR